MLLRIQRHDFRVEELYEASCEKARQIFLSFDWLSELALSQNAQRQGLQVCPIGMELTDDTGTRLFLSPVDRQAFCFNYVYHRFRSQFGVCQMSEEGEHFVARYPMDRAGWLIAQHFASEQGTILHLESEASAPGLPWQEGGSGNALK